MRAVSAEGDMRVGVPFYVELVRILEDTGVAIARGIEEQHAIAFVDLLPSQFGVGGGRSVHVLDGRDPPQQFLDGNRQFRRVVDELLSLGWVLDQGKRALADDMPRRFVASHQDEE